MSITNLTHLLAPRTIAVIGASDQPGSLGATVMHNLVDGRFGGPVMPVAAGRRAVAGILAYPNIASLPVAPDLAVICTAGSDAPALIEQLGQRGCRAAIMMEAPGDRTTFMAASKSCGLRVLGPDSLGLMVPSARLNASLGHVPVLPGQIAFVSQSGAMFSTILDWANTRGIGFSHFISLGGGEDVDFGDILDYLANDEAARAILLYVEDIPNRRDFVPAARAAARNKPLLLIKANRADNNRPIGAFLSETLAAPDEVFDAVARRAGALRVDHMDELFAAVETLARNRHMKGERLGIVCNGADLALMAADEMALIGAGEPARLINLETAAQPDRYGAALTELVETSNLDATLVIHAPTALSNGGACARAVAAAHQRVGGALLTCWLGGESSMTARSLFAEAGLPNYETIGDAIRGFRHLVDFHRNQEMLLETPPSDILELHSARRSARAIIDRALDRADGFLTDPETRELLSFYGVATVESVLAATPEDAAQAATRMGFPVALTYSSPDVPRKWDVGGVALNLENAEAVRTAAEAIFHRVASTSPELRFDGFGVQKMALRPHARQLMIGIACDPLFGPVLVFGEGGRAVEVIRDHALALPPLNRPLARRLIAQTRVSWRLEAQGGRPAADLDAIADALVRVSAMLSDNPEIIACDINPLFADDRGVLAVDARIRTAPPDQSDLRSFSILPYPAELEEPATLRDGSAVVLRPIRPEDEQAHADLVNRMNETDLRYRFFGTPQRFGHHQLARLTQIDYDREMAFIASRPVPGQGWETLGVVRTVADPDNRKAELAILVRSDLKGTGLGSTLMTKIIRHHQTRKTHEIGAQILSDNTAMLALARKCGFILTPSEDPEVTECLLVLGD